MRKLCSIILSVVLMLSAFYVVPAVNFTANAEAVATESTEIDFSEDAFTKGKYQLPAYPYSELSGFENNSFYCYNNGTDSFNVAGHAEFTTDPDTSSGHGNVVKMITIAGSETSAAKPSSFQIIDTTGTKAIVFKTGEKYTISLDIKKTKAQVNGGADFKIRIGFGHGNPTNYANTAYGYYPSYVTLFTEASEQDGNWKTLTTSFEVPALNEASYAFIYLVAPGSGNDNYVNEVYIDNVNLSPKKEGVTEGIDFSEDAFTKGKYQLPAYPYSELSGFENNSFYCYNNGTDSFNVAGHAEFTTDPDTSSGHGNVVKMITIAGSETSAAKPSSFQIIDTAGTKAIAFKTGEKYTISFDIKKTNAQVNGGADFKIRLGFGHGNPTNYANTAYGYYPYYVDLATEASEQGGGWKTLTANFQVPANVDSLYAFIYLVAPDSNNANYVNEVYMDNIFIAPQKEGVNEGIDFSEDAYTKGAYNSLNPPYATITNFENNSAYAYNGLNVAGHAQFTKDPDISSGHGNVVKMITIAGSETSAAKPSSFQIIDTAGTKAVVFKSGEKYTISLDIKKTNAVVNNNADFQIRLGFGHGNPTNYANTAYGYYPYYATLFIEASQQDENWKTLTTSFVVPALNEPSYAFIYLIAPGSDNANYSNEVYMDNIFITAKKDEKPGIDFSEPFFTEGEYARDGDYAAVPSFEGSMMYRYNGKISVGHAEITTDPDTASDHDNVIKMVNIASTNENYTKPSAIHVTNDDGTDHLKFYPGGKYTISFDIKKTKAVVDDNGKTGFEVRLAFGSGNPNNYANTSYGYYPDYVVLSEEENETNGSWKTITATVIVPSTVIEGPAFIYLVAPDAYHARFTDEVYIDNIIVIDHNLKVPEKEGYIFAGWYVDAELTTSYNGTNMPANGKLYEKWEPEATVPYSFETGFESEDYTYDVFDICDNFKTGSVAVNNDFSEAHTGTGRLTLTNTNGEYSRDKTTYLAAALINKDGSYFQVVKGGRYRLSYNVRFGGNSGAEAFLHIVTSSSVPTAKINSKNTKAINSIATGLGLYEVDGAWYDNEYYFIATETSKVYVMATALIQERSVDVDNLKIELVPENEGSCIQYFSSDTDDTPIYQTFGKVGSELLNNHPPMQNASDKEFAGWRIGNSSGEQFVSSKYPSGDLKLYASWKTADSTPENPTTDFSKPVVIDFEDKAGASAFYSSKASGEFGGTWGLYYVPDNEDGARSGSGYFRYNRVGHWETYRTMQFYHDTSPDNKVWLEPSTSYKITYYYKPTAVGGSNLYLVGFNSEYEDGYEILAENYLLDSNIFDQFGKWVKYETTIFTGEHVSSLGFALYGGYFTASIDDITITKLHEVTVSFNSNGGSEVNEITRLSEGTIVAPEDPVKEGFVFGGWYSDSACTKAFDFINTPIIENITLYAKWDTAGKKYETVVTYKEQETIVDIVPEDAHLDEKITSLDDDVIGDLSGDSVVGEINQSSSWWIWLIVAGGGVVVIGGIALLVIFLAKRHRKEQK